MGRAKRNKHAHAKGKPYAKPGPVKANQQSSGGRHNGSASQNHGVKEKSTAQQTKSFVPFERRNNILLIGEGDFSFSKALLRAHKCLHLTCTTFESQEALHEKHPQSVEIVDTILERDSSDREGSQPSDVEDNEEDVSDAYSDGNVTKKQSKNVKVLYDIDATKLGKPHSSSAPEIRKRGPYDRIVFNFPHVGGLTKDVNRQVRANQQLLVGFFNAAKPLLAKAGVIVVTLFEGDPYELWGIRNLARHCGLRVGRSFRFDANLYPGYHHARTLGNLRGESGWKGEERPARTYLLLGQDDELHEETMSRKRKLEKEADSDDEAFNGLD